MTRRARMVLTGGGALVALGGVAAWWRSRRAAAGGADAGLFRLPSFATREKATNAAAGADGFVAADPAALARQAGVDLTTYSLARVIGSEYASGNPKEKAAVAWTVVNDAGTLGWGVPKLLMYRKKRDQPGEHTGRFGSQEQGRRFSTARDPTRADVYIATMVLAGRWPDPTRGANGKGAVKFIDPSAQAALHRRCPCDGPRASTCRACYRSLDQVVADWLKEGREAIAVAGTDARKIIFIRPV